MECSMCGSECSVPPLVVRQHHFCCWDCVYEFFKITKEVSSEDNLRSGNGDAQVRGD